jgi:hypothetical protein
MAGQYKWLDNKPWLRISLFLIDFILVYYEINIFGFTVLY